MGLRSFLHKLRNSKSHGGLLARGAAGVFIVKSIGAGLLFALHIMLARFLGTEHYGFYVYVITWINILAILSLLGFQTSLVRFIAEYNANIKWGLLRGILRRSDQLVLASSVFVSLTCSIVVFFVRQRLTQELAVTFYIGFCLLPFITLCRLRHAALRAFKHVVKSELLLNIIRPIATGVGIVLLYLLLNGHISSSYAMTVDLLSVLVAAIAGTFFLYRVTPSFLTRIPPLFANREWLAVSFPLLLITGMNLLLKNTDVVMIGALRDSEQAGIYSAALKVSNLILFALTAVNSILAPIFSELFYTGQKKKLQRIVTLSARCIFVFTIVICVVLLVLGEFILRLFGDTFVVAYIPLSILLVGQVINSLAGSVGLIMSMSGQQNIMGIIIFISTIVNVALNSLLIPEYGFNGAAIATTVSMSLWNISMLFYVRIKLGINSTAIARVRL